MPLSKLVFKPGINKDQTNYSSEGSWYDMDKVRFRSGFPEKIGGWVVATIDEYIGVARSLFAWNTTDGGTPIGVGTNEKMYIKLASSLYDITPIRVTNVHAVTFSSTATNNCFATTNGSNVVKVTIASHGLTPGNSVTFSGSAAVGGVPALELNTIFYPFNITTNTFDILVTTSATSTVAAGGGTSITATLGPNTDNCFTTANGSNIVTVTITNHGALEGDWVTFSGVTGSGSPAKVNGIPITELNSEFKIFDVTTSTFKIQVTTAATSTATGGGTAINAAFQINIGNVYTVSGYGWGAGVWSRGPWSSGASVPITEPARLITQDNFNNDLVFNINGGDIYYWFYNQTPSRAVLLADIPGAIAVPQQVTRIQFTEQGFLLALGCTNYDPTKPAPNYTGTYDPLLIRWANVDSIIGPEPEVWNQTVTNTAGSVRIQTGSKIITSISTRQETLIWTDISLNSLQYLGTEEVFGLQQLSAHISIMGPNTVVGANNITYWMGKDKFYVYSGRVDTLPCTLRQYIFQNINKDNGDIFFGGSNTQFNEVAWFYCTADSNEINRYVIYNYAENIWYYGQLERTAWIDSGVIASPVAASNGWVYDHEVGVDDGQPLGAPALPITSFIQSADVDIDDGDKFMLIRRIIPDVNFTNSQESESITPQVELTVGVRNFPGAVSANTNASNLSTSRNVVTTATIDQYTNQVFVRCRGRQMNFKIASNTLGTQWQLGMPRIDARPDGTRG